MYILSAVNLPNMCLKEMNIFYQKPFLTPMMLNLENGQNVWEIPKRPCFDNIQNPLQSDFIKLGLSPTQNWSDSKMTL